MRLIFSKARRSAGLCLKGERCTRNVVHTARQHLQSRDKNGRWRFCPMRKVQAVSFLMTVDQLLSTFYVRCRFSERQAGESPLPITPSSSLPYRLAYC